MRKAISLWALALAMAAAASPAFAQDVEEDTTLPSTEARVSNFLGATGLLNSPSAYTVGDHGGSVFIAGTGSFFGGGGVVGIGDRFEIGFSVLNFDDDLGGDTEFLLNAKFNVVQEKNNWPAFSVGVIDAIDSLDTDPSWYLVASKYFTRAQTDQNFALKGHLGFGGGIFDEEIFAGAELFFKPYFSVMAEFVNDNINVGGRFHWNAFTATLALFDLDNLGGQVTYNIRW
jgi:hypothetical protein